MNIAFIGCGFVADYYITTLRNHPSLVLKVVMDQDASAAARFSRFWKVPFVERLEDVLADRSIELVVNLTNPASHAAVTRAALEAGKHVYSEKPLATDVAEAKALVALAASKGLQLGGAPCTVLAESVQTFLKALRDGRIGTPRLAYAELDDGPIHLMGFTQWRSQAGAPWPYRDELEVGCTLEHAGYWVGPLVAAFGPVKAVTGFNALLVPDKGVPETPSTPDLTFAALEHTTGVISRVTCSIYGSHDHSLRVFGDEGLLVLGECWDYGTSVGWYPRNRVGIKAEKKLAPAHRAGLGLLPMPAVRKARFEWKTKGASRMDFSRGILEVAEAAKEGRTSRLSADFSLHVNEVVLAMRRDGITPMTTRCEVPAPMPWALARDGGEVAG